MLKISIQGSEAEISAFFERIKEADGLQVQYKSTLTKRDSAHAWAHCKAGINAQSRAGDAKLRVEVRQRSNNGKRVSKKAGHVYLMTAYGAEGALGYKIGHSNQVKSRKRRFSVSMPFRVEFIAVIYSEDCRALEKELHKRYSSQRQRGSEFFTLLAVEVNQIIGMMSSRDKELLAELKGK